MNFSDMLVMVGPTGVPCDHSVIDPKTETARNNHWMVNDKGVLVARGSEYNSDYDVGDAEDYRSGKLKPPQLLTVALGEIVELKVSKDLIQDESWSVASMDTVKQAFIIPHTG